MWLIVMHGKWKQLRDDISLKTLCERKWHELRENLKIKHWLQNYLVFAHMKFSPLWNLMGETKLNNWYILKI